MSETIVDNLYNTVAPYTYSEWLQRNPAASNEVNNRLYNNYLRQWYVINSKINLNNTDIIKQSYINLLKELTFFFSEEERDLFLRDIDFNNDTEIIYAIPYFVQKLKEVALTLNKKREYIKNNYKKQTSTGSSKALEDILYEYILKSHTKTNNTTQIAISSLGSVFPDLSAVKDNFLIEIEEIYDDTSYASVAPLSADLLNVVPRIGENPLFAAFAQFLAIEDTAALPLSSFADYESTANIYNIAALNTKYLGNTIYSLTATRAQDTPEATVVFDMGPGNNWFFWPSGEVFTDLDIIQNVYDPITLQDSAFTLAESTGGTSYRDSDLFFVETKNGIEGAWLRGSVSSEISGTMVMTAQPGIIRSFIYPVPGYNLSTTYLYLGRKLDDENLIAFNLLDPVLRSNIIKQYFINPLETKNLEPIHINKTSLVYSGANAGPTTLQGDVILKRPPGPYNEPETPVGVFADENELTQSAFLYKLTSTELKITQLTNYIDWPLTSNQDSRYEQLIEITPDTCNPVLLGYIDINSQMVGAVAGEDLDSADIIYKHSKKGGAVVEVAWLQGGSVKDLASYNSFSKQIYDIPAVSCVNVPVGAIQPNLSFKCTGDTVASFVWCDVDTPADEVFKYREHTIDCPYISNKHEYLKNPTSTDWNQCTCKSIHYSPIGHEGDSITDYIGCSDYLFADPQGLGSSFTFTSWRDTRGYNFKNSPQFAFFKKQISNDISAGWGPGHWQTGNNTPFILKTGRRYTYFRSSLKNTNINLPTFIARYPYKKIISSVQSDTTLDIVLVIDISGSEFFSIEKTKNLCQRIINYINFNKGSQVGIVIFDGNAVVASYLTTDRQILNNTIDLISINNKRSSTNIAAGLSVAHKILTNTFGINVNKTSLVGLCSNLNVAIQTPFALIKTTNIPKAVNSKTIIILSDGTETAQQGKALTVAASIKQNTKIIAVDVGPNSRFNSHMEQIATSSYDYFNFERALLQSDSDNQLEVFASTIISNLYGNVSMQPVWRKAYIQDGILTSTYDVSDMVLMPGDHITYEHRSAVSYGSTTALSAPFVICVPLFGWNYNTSTYDGKSAGAKPYWGKVYNTENAENNFYKYSREIGGHIRYFENIIPISHPEISDLQFENNNYIEYRNNGCKVFVWKENITFTTTNTDKQWLKLNFCIQPANLKDLFLNNSFDKVFEQTEEPSTIVLNTYNDYVPSYYCYYARNAFTALQTLNQFSNNETFSQIQTGVAIPAIAPYTNLTNTHYVSIVNKISTNNLVTKEDMGGYLLPTKIGVPYYLGRGYTNSLDVNKIANYTGELIYLDPSIYTSNRGLSKQDQYSPYITVNIDNTWVKESYNSEKKAGTIINSTNYQKFVPYQSSYETYKYNLYGLSRQQDSFEFWTGPNNNIWNDEENYPTNYKKETYNLEKRTKSLLVTDKTLCIWQADLDGNNYGIYKDVTNLTQKQIKQTAGELWVRDINDQIIEGPQALRYVYENYLDTNTHYRDLTGNAIVDLSIANNTLCIRTNNGISLDQVTFNRQTNIIEPMSDTPAYISLQAGEIYGGMWYSERDKLLYINVLDINLSLTQSTILYTIYKYNTIDSNFKVLIQDTVVSPVAFFAVNTLPQFTYNKDTSTFNTTFIFKRSTITPTESNFNLFSINTKNLKNNPYIINAQIAV